jgi:hypothetical protein
MDEVFHAENVTINDVDTLVAYCKFYGYDADEPCKDFSGHDIAPTSKAGQISLAAATVQPQGVLGYDPSLDICEALDPISDNKLVEEYSKWSAFGPEPPHDFLNNLAENRVSMHYW